MPAPSCGSNADPSSLSPQVKSLCVDPENDLYLSVTSAWEITLKYMVGRLQLPVPAAGVRVLATHCESN